MTSVYVHTVELDFSQEEGTTGVTPSSAISNSIVLVSLSNCSLSLWFSRCSCARSSCSCLCIHIPIFTNSFVFACTRLPPSLWVPLAILMGLVVVALLLGEGLLWRRLWLLCLSCLSVWCLERGVEDVAISLPPASFLRMAFGLCIIVEVDASADFGVFPVLLLLTLSL